MAIFIFFLDFCMFWNGAFSSTKGGGSLTEPEHSRLIGQLNYSWCSPAQSLLASGLLEIHDKVLTYDRLWLCYLGNEMDRCLVTEFRIVKNVGPIQPEKTKMFRIWSHSARTFIFLKISHMLLILDQSEPKLDYPENFQYTILNARFKRNQRLPVSNRPEHSMIRLFYECHTENV
jgi:hypothetical protein